MASHIANFVINSCVTYKKLTPYTMMHGGSTKKMNVMRSELIIGENFAWSGSNLACLSSDIYILRNKKSTWGIEINYRNQTYKTCKSGICGQYMQMKWRNIKVTGCAVASCKKR